MFPPKGRVSNTYIPRAVLTTKPEDYKKYCKMSFGSYVQAVYETNPTNTTTPRTLGVISASIRYFTRRI